MAHLSFMIPKTRLRCAVLGMDGTLKAGFADFARVYKTLLGGDKCKRAEADNLHGTESPICAAELCGSLDSEKPRKVALIHNVKEYVDSFHHLYEVGRSTQLGVLRVQTANYSCSAMVEAHISNQNTAKAMDRRNNNQANSQYSEPNSGGIEKKQIGENVSKKDKINFLVNTLLDLKDNKEAVYGVLDAWVAWEHNFPIASLKRVLLTLEKEQQWHRVVQVIKWILSKGQGTTMGTYAQLIRALDMDHRAEEAHKFWVKKIGTDLHSVPWQLCRLMISIYYRNNMLENLVKLFKGLEAFDRKPPEKSIVQKVADAYEMLGLLEDKERVLEKYSDLFTETGTLKKSRKAPFKKNKKSGRGKNVSTSDGLPSTEDSIQKSQV